MESVWIVKTENTPDNYVDILKDKIDKDDRLFIVEISQQKRQGWLPSKAWEWLKANDEKCKAADTLQDQDKR